MQIIDLSSSTEKVHFTNRNSAFPGKMICFSHLRWDFIFQRPQHLFTRFAEQFDVFFIEEPVFDAVDGDFYAYSKRGENISVIVPHIKQGTTLGDIKDAEKLLFDGFMKDKDLSEITFWYYTPMALDFSRKYTPELVVYDCMDELSAFKFAPLSLKNLEKELLKKADIVFTGGHSLYNAKKDQHANIYPFPSSIETKHFLKSRSVSNNSANQEKSLQPTLGFYGVIDERFDMELIDGIAAAKPDWLIKLIGPVVKIDPDTLPKRENIHYLGSKSYQELPDYLASWDIALIPFLLNESTRFISPTKTPEYLAAGLPVISTAIRDVINPYGRDKMVSIGCNAEDFIIAAEKILKLTDIAKEQWLNKVDKFLAKNSWDNTCGQMLNLMEKTLSNKSYTSIAQ